MNTKQLGRSNVKVSDQIFGCWAIGGTYFTGAEDEKSIAAIREAVDHGITSLDTAYIYGNGHSEQIVGQAVKGYDREKLTIITKLWKTWMAKDLVETACDQSLKALDMDYIDVYFIHYPSDTGVPIADTMEALMKLKEKGKIRCIGVSNFSKDQLMEACKYGQIDVIQPCYSLVWRFLDLEEMDYCIQNQIGIISYCTLAQGILTGKFNKDTRFSKEDGRSRAPLFQSPYFEGALDVVDRLRPFAQKYDVTLAQLSIRWVMQKEGITAPIVGAKSPAQVQDNRKASSFVLSDSDFAAIDEISKAFAYQLPRFKTFFTAK